jgi:hypothetical protein
MMFLFSFKGHTRFDAAQMVIGIWACLWGASEWGWTWRICVPIGVLIIVPAIWRFDNGLQARHLARQELLQRQLAEAQEVEQ